jgi:hypothetical protein
LRYRGEIRRRCAEEGAGTANAVRIRRLARRSRVSSSAEASQRSRSLISSTFPLEVALHLSAESKPQQSGANIAMPLIRITTTDLLEQQLHSQAVRENRTVSKMGEILLREGLQRRREASASTERIVRAIRGEADYSPDAAS